VGGIDLGCNQDYGGIDMPTLLLRLVGPMQSWGVQSQFGHRDTGLEPSKSGVVGLVCAALGRDRSEPITDLAACTLGVRVDREGVLLSDYHTASNLLKAGGGIKGTELSTRFYLADAAFLVGLHSQDAKMLSLAAAALRRPRWMLALGRKAMVPSEPVAFDAAVGDGIVDLPLREALQVPARLRPPRSWEDQRVRLVLEDPHGPFVRPDQPISFARGARRFSDRRIAIEYIELTDAPNGSR
jgi:CRISPR system Cascade subunit CasD